MHHFLNEATDILFEMQWGHCFGGKFPCYWRREGGNNILWLNKQSWRSYAESKGLHNLMTP